MKILNPKSKILTWKNILLIITALGFGILTLGFSSGCARTVTSYVTYGDQMVVEVTLRGNYDADANRYFLVVGTGEAFKVPLPPPDNIDFELLEPGTTPRLGVIADYYTGFYYSWAGYVITDPGGYFLAAGPFTQGSSNPRVPLGNLEATGTKLKFNFRLSQIFGAAIPKTIYFDFFTAAWPSDAAKLSADHLASTNAYISSLAGSTVSVTDEENTLLAPALDILNCTVTIQ